MQFLVPKPELTDTDMPGSGTVKRFHTEISSRDSRNLVSAPGGFTRSSDVAPSVQPLEQQSQLEPIMPSRLCYRDKVAEGSSGNLFEDTLPSPHAQKYHTTPPSTPYGPLSAVTRGDKMPMENSLTEETILSPHAIRSDLVEPRATWDCFSQTEDLSKEYSDEQALKPRGSIADNLASMVERGWIGGDSFGNSCNDDELASDTKESKFHIRDTRQGSRSDFLSKMSPSTRVPSYSGTLSVSTPEPRSDSQHPLGQDNPPHAQQKEPRKLLHGGSQKRRQRQAKSSPAVDTTQRSSSDSGVRYSNTDLATPTGKQRAWTLNHFGHFTSTQSQIQRESSPTIIGPGDARDYRSSEQNHGSMKSPPSPEGSTPKSALNIAMLRDGQLRQNLAALSKITGSCCSSSNTKESTPSVSRSASFFRKFPWYKVALVDKQLVVQDLSKGGRGNDKISQSPPVAQNVPMPNQSEVSRDVGKSHMALEFLHEEDRNAPKIKSPRGQGAIDQQAKDAVTSHYKESPPSRQLTTTLQEISGAPEHPQDSHATCLKIAEERLLKHPHEVTKDMIGHARSPTRTGFSGTQPRLPSLSGSIDASSESPMTGDLLQSLQPQWPGPKEHSRMQLYTSSPANSRKLHANNRLERRSSGYGTARPNQDFAASPSPSHAIRSKVVNMSPAHVGIWTKSMPADTHRSDQDVPVRRELQGRRDKGIKKIQVTVTFDGAEELVIEATLKRMDRQEH